MADYDIGLVTKLMELGDPPEEIDTAPAYARWMTEQNPELGRAGKGEYEASAQLAQWQVMFAGFISDCHLQLVELLAPFGFESGMTTKEAIAAIPEDWSELDQIWRVIGLLTLMTRAMESFAAIREDGFDWEALARSAL